MKEETRGEHKNVKMTAYNIYSSLTKSLNISKYNVQAPDTPQQRISLPRLYFFLANKTTSPALTESPGFTTTISTVLPTSSASTLTLISNFIASKIATV